MRPFYFVFLRLLNDSKSPAISISSRPEPSLIIGLHFYRVLPSFILLFLFEAGTWAGMDCSPYSVLRTPKFSCAFISKVGRGGGALHRKVALGQSKGKFLFLGRLIGLGDESIVGDAGSLSFSFFLPGRLHSIQSLQVSSGMLLATKFQNKWRTPRLFYEQLGAITRARGPGFPVVKICWFPRKPNHESGLMA